MKLFMKVLGTAGGTALAALVVIGCAASRPQAPAATTTTVESYTIDGELTLHGGYYGMYFSDEDESCSGKGGYADIDAGAQVLVSDGGGNALATGELDAGEAGDTSGGFNVECNFSFTVPNVPKADFYKVEVSHRGGLTYTYSDLSSKGWSVNLKLGDY